MFSPLEDHRNSLEEIMYKTIHFTVLFVFWGIVSLGAQSYYSNHLLVSMRSEAAALPTGSTAKMHSKVSSAYNHLFEKYQVYSVERWLKSADARDVWNGVDFRKIYRLRLQNPALLNQAQKEFAALPSVRLCEKEPLIKVAMPISPTLPNDPFFDRQWYLKRIQADYAWSLINKMPQNTKPILIGIVDTGIDYLHPDIAPALYVNPGEDIDGDGQVTSSDYNGLDDDGNGFVDDLLGWDFSEASDSSKGDNDIRPPAAGSHEILSHGTHVAGIAGAVPENDFGISGIARNYRIIGTKQSRDDDYSHGYLYNAYDGVLYAAKMGADVINCSWGGGGFSQEAQDLIDLVTQKYGAIVVAAAGNDNNNNDNKHFYPSDYDHVITVAALDASDHKASFSNYGHVIDISAPGQSIFSTIHYYKGGYASWAGTSMASPVVAGSIALLKAFFPNITQDSLISRLLQGADPLNNALLGSGRVNIFNAIAPSFLPGLRVVDDSILVQDKNANGQIDPGETVHIMLTIENQAGWQEAHHVKITAHCTDSLVTLADSVALLGTIQAGMKKSTDALSFTLTVGEKHAYGSFPVRFDITCNPDSQITYLDHYSISILLSTYQKGFPWSQAGSLLPISLLHSVKYQKNFIVFISPDYGLYLVDAQGRIQANFPTVLQEYHRLAPIIADLNGDGEPEIVTVSQHGIVRAFTTEGQTLWQSNIDQTVYGNAAADDLDGDGRPEVVVATMQKQLHVLDANGKEWPGFPIDMGSFIDKGVALADVDGDSLPEMVLGTFDRKLHCLNKKGHELPGWPVPLPVRIHFAPVVARDNQGIHIFVADHNGGIHIFNALGKSELDTLLNVRVSAQPALGDVDGDGVVDLIAPFSDGTIKALSLDGTLTILPAPERDAPWDLSPLMVQANAEQRLFLGASKGRINVLNGQGQAMHYAPIFLIQTLAAQPAVGDLDGDGDLEYISANSRELIVLDLPDSNAFFKGWSAIMGNNRRTGYYHLENPTSIKKTELSPLPKALTLKIAPNPFNAAVAIEVRLPAKIRGRAMKVEVFNINGQRIKTLFNGPVRAQQIRCIWHGRNNLGRIVSSGLYFVIIRLDAHWFGRQILFVK